MKIKAENLVLCRGIPYFRIVIPQDLRKQLGRREYRRRIPNCSLQEATSIASFLRDKFQLLLRNARDGMLTDEQIRQLAELHLGSLLRHGDKIRLMQGVRTPGDVEADMMELNIMLSKGKAALSSNNLDSVSAQADGILDYHKLDCKKGEFDYRKLCLEILRKNVEYFELEKKRVAGEHVDLPAISISALPQNAAAPENPATSATLDSLLGRYVEEKCSSGAWGEKTKRSFNAALDIMFEYFGDCDIRSITHLQMLDFRDKIISKLPANMAKLKTLKEKSLEEISTMSSFFCWCHKHGFIDANPGDGLLIKENHRVSEERSVYEKEDIEKVVRSICQFQKIRHSERYWIPLIAMFSGMRQGEIAQLYTADVKQVEGIWCFDINENSKDKNVKSKAGIRIVPVHPALVKIGLLKYHEKLLRDGVDRMWPQLECKRDGYGQTFQRWYGRFNRAQVTDDPRKTFHSFRHAFINALKQLDVPEAKIKQIVGHEDSSITTGRYGKSYKPETLLEAISLVDYSLEILKILGIEEATPNLPTGPQTVKED